MPVADAAGTKRLLGRMLGPRACVRKRREVWLYENARIHLDTVEGLGRFIEIEVVVTGRNASGPRAHEGTASVAGHQAERPDRRLVHGNARREAIGEREHSQRLAAPAPLKYPRSRIPNPESRFPAVYCPTVSSSSNAPFASSPFGIRDMTAFTSSWCSTSSARNSSKSTRTSGLLM